MGRRREIQTRGPALINRTGDVLKNDIEGMKTYHSDYASYLVASTPYNNSFVICNLWQDYSILFNLRIDMNLSKGIDGIAETDGLRSPLLPCQSILRDGSGFRVAAIVCPIGGRTLNSWTGFRYSH